MDILQFMFQQGSWSHIKVIRHQVTKLTNRFIPNGSYQFIYMDSDMDSFPNNLVILQFMLFVLLGSRNKTSASNWKENFFKNILVTETQCLCLGWIISVIDWHVSFKGYLGTITLQMSQNIKRKKNSAVSLKNAHHDIMKSYFYVIKITKN